MYEGPGRHAPARTGNPISKAATEILRRARELHARCTRHRDELSSRARSRARARRRALRLRICCCSDEQLARASRLRRVCRRRRLRELRALQARPVAQTSRRRLAVAHRDRPRSDRPGLRPRRDRSRRDRAVRRSRRRRSTASTISTARCGSTTRPSGSSRRRSHSLGLSARTVSGLNPRVLVYQDISHKRRPVTYEEFVVAGFTRGEQLVELAALDPATYEYNFYLLRFGQACNRIALHARGPADREDRERLDRLDALRRP